MRLFTELIMKIITLIISAGEIIADNIQNRVHREISYRGVKEQSFISDYSLELRSCQVSLKQWISTAFAIHSVAG